MSRWLDITRKHLEGVTPLPDTPTKGDKSPFCRVLSGCRVDVSEINPGSDSKSTEGWQFIDRFHEKAAILESDEGLSRDQATWLAALAVFVRPSERAAFFGDDGNLLPGCRELCLAIDLGLVVTFHLSGRVSFNGGQTSEINPRPGGDE